MDATFLIKEQLVRHLHGGEAFMPVDKMLPEIPFKMLGIRPEKMPYSFYEVFYHLWYAQKDILAYCKEKQYTPSAWPKDYWPKVAAPHTQAEWTELQEAYFNDRKEIAALLIHTESDLLMPVRSGTGHTLLREVMLVIEHNAYHTGQLLVILRALGLYKS